MACHYVFKQFHCTFNLKEPLHISRLSISIYLRISIYISLFIFILLSLSLGLPLSPSRNEIRILPPSLLSFLPFSSVVASNLLFVSPSLIRICGQLVYMSMVGTFPFNSFLSGFLACVGEFVLLGMIRAINSGKGIQKNFFDIVLGIL